MVTGPLAAKDDKNEGNICVSLQMPVHLAKNNSVAVSIIKCGMS